MEKRKCKLESCSSEFVPTRAWQDFHTRRCCQVWHTQERRRATELLQRERELRGTRQNPP